MKTQIVGVVLGTQVKNSYKIRVSNKLAKGLQKTFDNLKANCNQKQSFYAANRGKDFIAYKPGLEDIVNKKSGPSKLATINRSNFRITMLDPILGKITLKGRNIKDKPLEIITKSFIKPDEILKRAESFIKKINEDFGSNDVNKIYRDIEKRPYKKPPPRVLIPAPTASELKRIENYFNRT